MGSEYKEDIIRLRRQKKSYREIEDKLSCSKGTIAYHCKQEGLEDIGLEGGHGHSKMKDCPECGSVFRTPASLDRTYCSRGCFNKSDKSAIDYGDCGGYKRGSGWSSGCWYRKSSGEEVWLDSSYELAFVWWLDENVDNWKRDVEGFNYSHENEERKYIPEFYLPDKNLYVEIKGFKTDRDESKWNQFPRDLEVLFKDDLEELGCNINGAVDELV